MRMLRKLAQLFGVNAGERRIIPRTGGHTACKNCVHEIFKVRKLAQNSNPKPEHLCTASPVSVWSAFEGKCVLGDYRSCNDVNDGVTDCKLYKAKGND